MTVTTDRRLDALRALQGELAKKSKTDPSVPRITFGGQIPDVETIPTGVPSLDAMLGGGFPKGRITAIAGAESNGKSTLAYTTIAELQRRDPNALAILIDSEGSYQPSHAKRLGVANPDNIIVIEDTGGTSAEDILKVAEATLDLSLDGENPVKLIVLDSVAALQPRAMTEGELGDATMMALARVLSGGLGRLNPKIRRANVPVLLINQLRTDPKILYGSNQIMPGGKAIRFYSSLILYIGRHDKVLGGEGKEQIGHKAVFRTQKNKVNNFGLPTTEAEITSVRGFDFAKNVLALGLKCGVIEKSAAFMTVDTLDGPLVKVQGAAKMEQALRGLSLAARNDLYDRVVKEAIVQRGTLFVDTSVTADPSDADELDDEDIED